MRYLILGDAKVFNYAYPTSKAATVEYLKNHFDEDLDLPKIYRYLDKLSDHQHEIVQDISVRHTAKLFGGNMGVLCHYRANSSG